MILGKVSGSATTKRFGFEAEARVNKLDYVSAKDPEGKWVLAIVDSVVQYHDSTKVSARVIGYRDSRGFLQSPRVPIAPGTPVYAAEKEFISETLGLSRSGAYIGLLEGYDIRVMLDIEHMIRKHIAVLAKTGAGKSYVVGVLLEELAEHGIPVVVIDPHGEYASLRRENRNKEEIKHAARFGVEPKSYRNQVSVFGVSGTRRISLSSKLSAQEIFQMLPAKLSSSQKGLLYSALRDLEGRDYNLNDIIEQVSAAKSNAKWNLLSMLEFLKGTGLFSENPTLPSALVRKGKVTVIDLKEAKQETQSIVVMRLVEELFRARKHGVIPPFLMVIEEAHNFCPERGFGEVASSRIIRTVASEGRKFGFGLCVVTQRPARIDKSVLSQCNTQIILKVTNPNDLKAITDSVEGVSAGMKEEIKDLPVGAAMIVGATEHPLVVDVRVRRTQHGGENVKLEPARPKQQTESEIISFPVRIPLAEIERKYGKAFLLHYPLWKVRSRYGSRTLNFYVDGITGEVVFRKGESLERSTGIRELLELPPSSRLIILYLLKSGLSTPERISGELKIPLSSVKSNIEELRSKGLVSMEGHMLRGNLVLQNVPPNPQNVQITETPEKAKPEGIILGFMISPDFAKKVSELWDIEISGVELVHYPYWVTENHETNEVVDAVFGTKDEKARRAISTLL